MNTEFLNTEFFVLNLIMILSSVVILLKSRFNLIILIKYILFWAVLLILSKSLSITGICMSVIFGIFYYYIIPNRLKKERIEDEKITEDLDYFFSLSKEEKEEYYKKRNIYKKKISKKWNR